MRQTGWLASAFTDHSLGLSAQEGRFHAQAVPEPSRVPHQKVTQDPHRSIPSETDRQCPRRMWLQGHVDGIYAWQVIIVMVISLLGVLATSKESAGGWVVPLQTKNSIDGKKTARQSGNGLHKLVRAQQFDGVSVQLLVTWQKLSNLMTGLIQSEQLVRVGLGSLSRLRLSVELMFSHLMLSASFRIESVWIWVQ